MLIWVKMLQNRAETRAIPTVSLKVEKAFRKRNNFRANHVKSYGSKRKDKNLFQMSHLSGKELKLITESIHRQIKKGMHSLTCVTNLKNVKL